MDVMAIAASGMQQDLRRMETISQNLANVLTPGYKKQIASSATGVGFAAQVDSALGGAASAGQTGAQSAVSLSIDPSAGTLRYTGNAQDVAIDGPDFFEVAARDGSAYTRQGSFHTDLRGRLVSAAGWPVMGVSGEIVVTGAYTIDAGGDVRQGDRVVARLKMVRFANPEAMVPLGAGVYGQGGARLAEQGASTPPATVRVGYQENSNVSSPQEMVRLTETVRHFESLQRIMQGYDETLEKTIRKLGEF